MVTGGLTKSGACCNIVTTLQGEGGIDMPVLRIDEEVYKVLQGQAEPFVDTPNTVLRRLLGLDKPTKRASPTPKLESSISAGPMTGLVPLEQLPVRCHALPPKRLRLPNGQERGLQWWKSLLVEVARYLVQTGKLGPNHCPIQRPPRRERYLIHTQRRHPSGRDFFEPVDVGSGLWLETHASAPLLYRQAKFLLRRFGEDLSEYLVEIS